MLKIEKNRTNCISYLEQQLKSIPIERIAKECNFQKRKARKITAKNYLLGFFMMLNEVGGKSYNDWAMKISFLIKRRISKQAINKKMNETQIEFLKKILRFLIGEKIKNKRDIKNENLKMFRNVIVEDSTNIQLNDRLYKEYPGNNGGNKKTKNAIMRIQTAFNITKNKFMRFEITSYRENDLKYSEKIFQIVQKGDLLIRDLGYFVIKIFRKLNEDGVFYISRFKKKINVFLREKDENVIDLAKMLRKRGNLDIEVFLGEKEKLPVRLIALPVTEEIASKRRMKAKENKDGRYKHTKEYYYLLGWELFITNVGKHKITPKDIMHLYYLRWRIESIFKTWKSYLRITETSKIGSKIRIDSYILCMLIFITILQVHMYNFFLGKRNSSETFRNKISLLKFTKYIANNMMNMFFYKMKQCKALDILSFENISYYCLYDIRKDRQNYFQKLYSLS